VPNARDRDAAKRRYAKRQARSAVRAARTRRTQQVVGSVVAVVVVAVGLWALYRAMGSSAPTTAAGTSTSTSGPSTSPTPTRTAKQFASVPPKTLAAGRTWTLQLTTNRGPITLQLDGAKAPQTVSSFLFLARQKYFDGSPCHRLTTAAAGLFVLQCGDPTGTGSGGPGYSFGVENAPKDGSYPTGTLAMARAQDPNSNGSQFFMVYKDTKLTTGGGYSIFGKVTSGLDLITAVAADGTPSTTGSGPPKDPVTITSVQVESK
jgi:peptidyl-prolyl cis-trans isomerase B (cyclophilin B)